MGETLRFAAAALLFAAGAVTVILAVLGVFKFRFVMNRMHCAAVIDAMALLLILLGLAFAAGSMAYIPKLLMILMFQWIGSPIASHMVGRLEVDTEENLAEHMQICREEAAEEGQGVPESGTAE